MAELGLCSRREADEYIEKGWVRVDGRVISELGARVRPEQAIELDRRGQTAQDRRVTILLNKPVGYVSGQAEDGYEPASVLITAENRWAEDPPRRASSTPTTGPGARRPARHRLHRPAGVHRTGASPGR
jgi:23S rRNA pseudouridine2604 synthase